MAGHLSYLVHGPGPEGVNGQDLRNIEAPVDSSGRVESFTTASSVTQTRQAHQITACGRRCTKTTDLETAIRRVAEITLGELHFDNKMLGNVYSFVYFDSRLSGYGDNEADVRSPSASCEYGAASQTAHHVASECSLSPHSRAASCG